MDPDANLAEQRRLAKEILDYLDATTLTGDRTADDEMLQGLAGELAEHVARLDGWIVRGGMLPAAWQQKLLGTADFQPQH